MKDDDERFYNFITHKMYATDEEIAESAPALFIVVLVIIGVIVYFNCC